MPLRSARFSAALFVFALSGTPVLHSQSAVEYGIMTGNSAAATAGAARIPFPNVGMPGAPGNAGPSAPGVSAPAGVTAGTAETAAKSNLQFFQSHAGADAGSIGIHTVPEHASVWVDGKFLGSAPVDLKLAPGHHQVLVRAPNMQESTREFDVAAKQVQSLDFALKSAYQNQVVIHWGQQQK
jgi:hypothetical protein